MNARHSVVDYFDPSRIRSVAPSCLPHNKRFVSTIHHGHLMNLPSTAPMSSARTKIHLILTGASGYLGQHLLSHWIQKGVLHEDSTFEFQITALYHKSETFPKAVEAFRRKNLCHTSVSDVVLSSIDLTNPSESDIQSLLQFPGAVAAIVVHAAALSSPRACQANPEYARAINVPTKFLDALLIGGTSSSSLPSSSNKEMKPTTSILALSTDQVYDGKQAAGSYYKEDEKDGLNPVNVYGQTKLELEGYLLRKHEQKQSPSSRLVALRSSIILGPKAPIDPDCAHGTFLDFCQSRGQQKEATTFFTNEYRSVVRVDTVIQTIERLVYKTIAFSPGTLVSKSVVYNMGGPVRVNRMELAKAVFDKFGYDASLLIEAKQTSPMSPLDISMDSSLLLEESNISHGTDENKNKMQPQSVETFLKELVDYAFGQE